MKHKEKGSKVSWQRRILILSSGWAAISTGFWLNSLENRNRLTSAIYGIALEDYGIHPVGESSVKEDDDDDRVYPALNLSNSSSCRILVSKKQHDFHYETFESAALQYPLPWGNMTPRCDSQSGLQPNQPIIVDFLLGFVYNDWKLPEGLGWKDYFEKHLRGRRRRRRTKGGGDDERWIQYGSIVDSTPELVNNISWSSYAANIEINCDWLSPNLIKGSNTLYCVYHGQPKDPSLLTPSTLSRICRLNPQNDPNCWFIPSVFPKFPPPPKPFVTTLPSNDKVGAAAPTNNLNVCMSWKSLPKRGELMRDPTVLVDALRTLKPANVKVLVIGRNAKVPRQFIDAGVDHYVTVESGKVDFYEYQKLISTCHVLVPLLHPEDNIGTDYFNGRLSGMISLAIGRKIPTLLHEAATDIYKHELTAFNAPYNSSSASFIQAFSKMLDYYNNSIQEQEEPPSTITTTTTTTTTTEQRGTLKTSFIQAISKIFDYYNYTQEEPPSAVEEGNIVNVLTDEQSSSSSLVVVPPILHFIYVPINETCGPECTNGKSIRDIIATRDPPILYDNIFDIINQ